VISPTLPKRPREAIAKAEGSCHVAQYESKPDLLHANADESNANAACSLANACMHVLNMQKEEARLLL
jgi:hypothetical protein